MAIVGKISGPSNYALLAASLDQILAGGLPQSRTEGSVQPTPE
jgi:hypothetical protein